MQQVNIILLKLKSTRRFGFTLICIAAHEPKCPFCLVRYYEMRINYKKQILRQNARCCINTCFYNIKWIHMNSSNIQTGVQLEFATSKTHTRNTWYNTFYLDNLPLDFSLYPGYWKYTIGSLIYCFTKVNITNKCFN